MPAHAAPWRRTEEAAQPDPAMLPHSVEPEQSVLGGLLLDCSAWPAVADILRPADFFVAEHRLIFVAVLALAGQGQLVDVITVHAWLQDRGQAQGAGGLKYINDLAQSVPSASGVVHYARIVRDRAALRELIVAGDAIKAVARNAHDAQQALADARQILADTKVATSRPMLAHPVTLDLRALSQGAAPPRHWFVTDWLGPGPTLFAAGGGVGKTLLAQQTATALAIGRGFIGEVPEPCRSLMWCCEDDADELWRRQQDISAHFEIQLDEPADMLTIQSRRGVDNVLMTIARGEANKTNNFRELQQQVNDLAADVLWLDNIAHLFAGDENNRGEVTAFINALAGLVTGRPFSVVLLAHVARQLGSEFAGSAAWENAVRMRWLLGSKLPGKQGDETEDAPEGVRYLAKRKANYTARDYVRFSLRDGVLVPDDTPASPGGIVAKIDERRADEVLILGFRALQAMGIAPTDGKTSPDFLPRQIAAKGLAEGYSANELTRAMNRLMGRGMFVRGAVGSYANRSPKQGLILKD